MILEAFSSFNDSRISIQVKSWLVREYRWERLCLESKGGFCLDVIHRGKYDLQMMEVLAKGWRQNRELNSTSLDLGQCTSFCLLLAPVK